ncbi:MAG: ProQ/FinO family protein [Candidatus Tectomicrobia bacterium]|nr:ProQ/FinO family protein [Candidatus Tectomicrobia bacterium]
MSTTLHDALASVGLAPADDDQPASDLASESPRSRKLSADDFALYQRLADAFPACFDLQHPLPLMHNIDTEIRHHPDFRLVSLTSLGNVLVFVTGRRPYLLSLTRKGARRHALDGTPMDPIEPDVRQAASAELARRKTKRQAAKV